MSLQSKEGLTPIHSDVIRQCNNILSVKFVSLRVPQTTSSLGKQCNLSAFV